MEKRLEIKWLCQVKVAFDTQVSRRAVEAAQDNGFNVVYWAGHTHDELWFREAMDRGAEVFVSPDWDIAVLANRFDKTFIKLPQNLGKGKLVDFVVNQLVKLRSSK